MLGVLNMDTPMHSQFLVLLLLLSLKIQLNHATSTVTGMSKDQISCTMCSSCDNPCQPIFSPPPPSPPPPPPPPPSSDYNCPPPPSKPQPLPPPYNGGGGGGGGGDGDYYYPPTNPSLYAVPPPPNPIVPYFPFYFYNPPPPINTVDSKSVQFKKPHSFVTCLIFVVFIFLFL